MTDSASMSRRPSYMSEFLSLGTGGGGGGDSTSQRLAAMLRLGPLYEEIGDTVKAVEAYERMVDLWADADARGQITVRRFQERIAELGG